MAQPLRMGGLNSGLDTESIINALTANSKLKITKQERLLLKYKATQDAYRDVISKFQGIQDKYFDILNKKTNLKGSTMWSQFSSKTLVNGEEKKVAGVNVTTSINSVSGSYDMRVNKTATQSTLKGTTLSGGAKLELSDFAVGGSYGITVTAGDATKNITFTGGATADETLESINNALSEAFGESNLSASGTSNKGMVYVGDDGSFVSRAGKGITISGVGTMESSANLDLAGIKSGNNSISVRVGDEVVNLSFQTLEDGYFDEIFDADGKYKTGLDAEQTAKVALHKQIKDDYIEMKKFEEYENWKESATEEEKQALLDTTFTDASNEHREKYLEKYLKQEYDTYAAAEKKAGNTAASFDDWKAANYAETDGNTLYEGFKDYYYDKTELTSEQITERNTKVEKYLQDEYAKYTQGGGTDNYDTWKTGVMTDTEGDVYKGYLDVYNSVKPEEGYELDKETWSKITYNEYEAYKKYKGTVTDEIALADFNAQAAVDHYNKTSLENSIGAAETESGAKLSVEISGDTATITAEDKDGNPVSVSVTSAKDSTNNFGAAVAQTSISQISNSTKLSDLGISAGDDGKYEFTINGVSFSFKEDTNVKEMMRTVNSSDAGVKMTYSSLENAFTITSNAYGINSEVEITDGSEGLLSAIGLTQGTYTQGTNLEVEVNGSVFESDGNSITADGTTFNFTGVEAGTEFTVEVEKDNSAIADTIKGFVEDYNKLIEEVYKYLDQEPDSDYYFLADQDKEDLALSEKNEEKWEEKAKEGLLYHDSTISSIMSKLRVALMGTVQAADGKMIGLASLGLNIATDYKEHGKIEIDEEKLNSAINEYGEDISKLFSDEKNGIMVKFDEALESAVGTTGEKGTLINKAGLATGTSATDNYIYDQMKRITSKITALETRYENEQTRLWKKYSAMESMLSTLNSQSASFSSYFGGMM